MRKPAVLAVVTLITLAWLPQGALANSVAASWTTHGPDGGSVASFAIDPSRPRTVYAGTLYDGVFKSTDGATSWTPARAGLPPEFVQSLAVDPTNPGTLYAALSASGVYRSIDGGAHWAVANQGLTDLFENAVAIDPSHTSTVYLGARAGLFISRDGAATWTAAPFPAPYVTALAVDAASGAVWAGTLNDGLYRSKDGGLTWAVQRHEPDSSIRALALDPSNPSTVYAATYHDGVVKTTDSGHSWAVIDQGLPPYPHVYSISISQSHPASLAVGLIDGVYTTSDGGAAWALAGNVPIAPFSAVAIDPVTSTTLYAGTCGDGCANAGTGGVFRSTDGGSAWDQTNRGLVASILYSLAPAPSSPGTLYAGLGTDVAKTTDEGGHWAITPASYGKWGALAVDPTSSLTAYAGAGYVFKTVDGGGSWSFAGSGLPGGAVVALAIDPAGPATVWAGTNQSATFVSMDGGGHWVARNNGFPPGTGVISLAIDPADTSAIFAGTAQHGLYETTNGGATWGKLSLSPSEVFGLAIDPVTTSTIFAAASGGIYRSTDGGATWRKVLSNAFAAVAVAVDPANASEVIASTTGPRGGVFLSTDGGTTWSRFDRGIYDPFDVVALAFDQDGSRVHAATQGGVYDIRPG